MRGRTRSTMTSRRGAMVRERGDDIWGTEMESRGRAAAALKAMACSRTSSSLHPMRPAAILTRSSKRSARSIAASKASRMVGGSCRGRKMRGGCSVLALNDPTPKRSFLHHRQGGDDRLIFNAATHKLLVRCSTNRSYFAAKGSKTHEIGLLKGRVAPHAWQSTTSPWASSFTAPQKSFRLDRGDRSPHGCRKASHGKDDRGSTQ